MLPDINFIIKILSRIGYVALTLEQPAFNTYQNILHVDHNNSNE